MFRYIILAFIAFGGYANAHQFTPTYPIFNYSFAHNVVSTKMELLNMRKDINYYEINVYDDKWNPIPFVSSPNGILYISYLKRKNIEIYINISNINRVTYICSESKIISLLNSQTVIASKVCSKKK